jgi:ankyrin repeat protein
MAQIKSFNRDTNIRSIGANSQSNQLSFPEIVTQVKNNGTVDTALRDLRQKTSSHTPASLNIATNRPVISKARAWAQVPVEYKCEEGVLLAVKNKDIVALERLLQSRNPITDINYRDSKTGDTAWGIARREDNHEMMRLLRPALDIAAQRPALKSNPQQGVQARSTHNAVRNPPDIWPPLQEPLQTAPAKVLEITEAPVTQDAPSHASDGTSPLFTAILAGQIETTRDLIAAGADTSMITSMLQDPKSTFVPEGYRGEDGLSKALADEKMDILAIACYMIGEQSKQSANTRPSEANATSRVSQIESKVAEPSLNSAEDEVKNSPYFHHSYHSSIEEHVLHEPGMYLFRMSSNGKDVTMTYRHKGNYINNHRLGFENGKIKIGSIYFDNIQELLDKALDGVEKRVGIRAPEVAYNALDVKYKFSNGIGLALADENMDALETIVLNRKDLKYLDDQCGGKTPLTFALERGNERLARLLISLDANVTVADSNGDIPLHIAARTGQLGMIELLRAHGAPCLKENREGKKPCDVAGSQAAKERLTPAVAIDEEIDDDSGAE